MNHHLDIGGRVALLRDYMRRRGLAAFVVPDTDPHGSEYVPEHWASRTWISGFTGSAGTAVLTLDSAALWTDSRYFLQAAEQLRDTPFQLMKTGERNTPSIADFLKKMLRSGDSVGIDAAVFSHDDFVSLASALSAADIGIVDAGDPFEEIWNGRPPLPTKPVSVHPLKYSGESVASKLERLRRALQEQGADAMVVTALDEVAWLLNMRGSDVKCNPVFLAFLLVLPREVHLYIRHSKLTAKVQAHLTRQGVILHHYDSIYRDVNALEGMHLLIPSGCNERLYHCVRCKRVEAPSPIAGMKAVKNKAEMAGFRAAMLRDGVAMVKFLRWLKPAVARGGVTEIGIDKQLTAFRKEQPLFRGLSFDTIAAYGAHGAIVHYEATPESDVELKPNGFLLLDSGAQYEDGTTDITRTICLGEPTPEERHIYTLVLKGHIALSRLKFPDGAAGTQLDMAAREAMWREGYNYGHGTGHGVGSYLCVHEGPHQIRMEWRGAPLKAGMTVTDEPGIYLPDRFGVRTENTLLVVPYLETEFGLFLGFEPLTLCPIDTTPIDIDLMTEEELSWLNLYHRTVEERLRPLLDDEGDRQWLSQATAPISK